MLESRVAADSGRLPPCAVGGDEAPSEPHGPGAAGGDGSGEERRQPGAAPEDRRGQPRRRRRAAAAGREDEEAVGCDGDGLRNRNARSVGKWGSCRAFGCR
jgi:hypothetical protein